MAKQTKKRAKKVRQVLEKIEESEDDAGDINISKKQQKQLLAIIVTIAVILIIVATIYILAQKSKKFEYDGMKFERIMYDKLPLYYTLLSIHRSDKTDVNYNLYLRNDPRGNNIPVNADIKFLVGKSFVTVDEGMQDCGEASLGLINLASFLSAMGFDIKGATSSRQVAENTGHPYVTCNNSLDNTVISFEITQGESVITQADRNPNCFVLKVKDCNVINISEKFTIEMIKQVWRE